MICVLVHVKRRDTEIGRETERGIYFEELAYVLIETENSHDLPPARCRHRKAGGLTPVQV